MIDNDSATPDELHVELDERFAIIPEALLIDPVIPAEAVRVYGVLVRYGTTPSNCYPSHSTIAAHMGKSPRSVPAWIRALEVGGWVERVARFSPEGDPTSNGYRVFMVPGGRATERGVRAGERGGVRAPERGGSAPGSAPKESQGNESQKERETDSDVALVRALAGFDEFWAAYPRKTARRSAEQAWPRAVKRSGDSEAIIAGARRYAADPNREDSFTAHGATWLNGDRWLDDPLPARSSGKVSRLDQKLAALEQSRTPRPGRPDPRSIGAGS